MDRNAVAYKTGGHAPHHFPVDTQGCNAIIYNFIGRSFIVCHKAEIHTASET